MRSRSRRRTASREATKLGLAFLTLIPAFMSSGLAQAAEPLPTETFITLGTKGGPVPTAERSQPANLLVTGGQKIVIDAGDGLCERLAAAGVRPAQVTAVFLSHLHLDHTAGLAGLLGLRYAVSAPGVLTVYGPPGTKALVQGLVESMKPVAGSAYGYVDEPYIDPTSGVRVVELVGGSRVQLGGVSVTTVENSHYSFPISSPKFAMFKSLAFRFDTPARSIAFSGDTGPSHAVEKLARDADLLVLEVMDVDSSVAELSRQTLPPEQIARLSRHFREHHLSPQAAGEMAARARAHRLVLTHIASRISGPADIERLRVGVAGQFKGPFTIASDLERF